MDRFFDLVRSAERVDVYVWAERLAFRLAGEWSVAVAEPEVKVALAAEARHHAWRAELWQAQRSPRAGEPELDPDAPPPALAPFAAALAGAEGTVERLVGLARVLLPRLGHDQAMLAAGLSSVADGPLLRVLELVAGDQERDRRRIEGLVQALLTGSAAVRRAADHQARLELTLVGGEGLVGAP